MSTPRDEWRGHYERNAAEAKVFAEKAASFRRRAQDLRKARDFLGALMADSRAAEYRRSRDDRKAEAAKIKAQWRF